MSGTSSGDIESIPFEIHAQIGDLLERLEDAWQADESPRLEEFLPKIEESYRPVLIRELLRLELDYRARAGHTATPDEYTTRLPEYRDVIERVFLETRPDSSGQRPEEPLPDDLPRFGPYIATKKLGEGGFGTVYLATHDETGHQVAIKVGSELLHEAKTLLSLKHPSIIRVLHVGRDAKNRPYLVMDYMQGASLRQRIDPEHPMLPEEAVEIASRIAEALHAAHSHPEQIYHRDLKPENVLFDEDGNACVADFGLALTEAQQVAHRGDFSGTVFYQSPEQLRGQADWIDARSDIWAVGIILYEMLTGHRPFSGEDLREQILHKNPKSPRQTNDRVPEALEAIFLKCLEKDVRNRYQTADSLASALRGQELGVNPYKGLESFEEIDADRFFGRTEQTERLKGEFTRLYEASLSDGSRPRILPILGPSGCGKSSLVKAGLVPALRRGQLPNRKEPRVAVFRPRTRPLKSLADVLDRFAGGAEDAGVLRSRNYVQGMKQPNDSGQSEGLWWIVDSLPEISDSPLVVVVDQFEELFIECEDEEERDQFINNLLYATSQKDGAFSAVLTLRSDFLAETQQHERLNQIIANQGLLIPAMKESELREAITEPARKAGYEFDEAVVNLLVKESFHRDGALPLLQVVLTRIWDRLQQGIQPTTTYQQLGGVGGALAKAAESLFEGLSAEEQQISRHIFLGLVKLGEGAQDTRRTAQVSQILSYKDDPELARQVLTKFSAKDSRFITLKREKKARLDEPDVTTAELTHEALIEHWQRLRSWLDSGRSDLRFKERLADAAERWDELGRPEGSLWRPPELDVLRRRRPHLEDDLSQLQKEFVDAAVLYDETLSAIETERRERDEQRQRKEVRLLRRAAATFCLLMLALGGTAYWAIGQKEVADEAKSDALEHAHAEFTQRQAAQSSLAFAQISQAQHECEEGDVAFGIQLYFNALQTAEGVEDERLSRVCRLNIDSWAQELHILLHALDHPEYVADVGFSHDGKILATACDDGHVRFWSLEDGTRIPQTLAHPDEVTSLAFHPLESVIATGCVDGKVRLWRIPTDGQSETLAESEHHPENIQSRRHFDGHMTGVTSIEFSYDGTKLVTGGYDGTVSVWETDKLTRIAGPLKHSSWATDVTFCIHGDCVAASGDESSIFVWEVSTGKLINSVPTEGNFCFALDVDCLNGRFLLGTLQDHNCVQWHEQSDCVLRGLQSTRVDSESIEMPHWGWINAARYSGDGEFIISGCKDGLVRIWNPETGTLYGPPLRTSGSVKSAEFSTDSTVFAAACGDGTVRVWRLAWQNHIQAFHHIAWISDVSFDMSGKRLLVVGKDQYGGNAPRIWDVSEGTPVRGADFPRFFYIGGASFDSTGNILALAEGKSVRWFNVREGTEVASTNRHTRRIQKLVKHAIGKHFATGADKGGVCVWTFDSDRLVTSINSAGHGRAIAFDPQFDLLYTGSDGHEIQTWTLDGQRHGHPLNVGVKASSLACSPQGGLILVGGTDGSVRLWDLTSGDPVGRAMSHVSEVTGVGFSPDGSLIATCGADRTGRVWDPITGTAIGPLFNSADVVNTLEWSPDGKFIVNAGRDRLASFWRAPTPISGTRDELRDFLQSITGLSIDKEGAVHILTVDDRPTCPQQLLGTLRTRKETPEVIWDRARRCLAKRNWSGAIVSLTRVLASNQEDCLALFERGRAYKATKQEEKALVDFNRVIATEPAFPDARHQRGHVLLNLEFFDKALIDFQEALKLAQSGAGHLHFFVAKCQQGMGDLPGATASCIQAIEKDTSKENRPPYVQVLEELAKGLEEQDAVKAREAVDSIKIMFPSSGQAFWKQSEQSVEGVHRAIAAARMSDRYHGLTLNDRCAAGELLLISGDLRRAKTTIEQAIAEGADHYWFYESLGWALYGLGEKNECKRAMEKALERLGASDSGETAPAGYDLSVGTINRWIAAYFCDEVTKEEFLNRWRSDDREVPKAWFYIGSRLEMDGRSEEAIKAYETAVELGKHPNADPIHYWAEYKTMVLRQQVAD